MRGNKQGKTCELTRGETDRAKRRNLHAGKQTGRNVGTHTRGSRQGKALVTHTRGNKQRSKVHSEVGARMEEERRTSDHMRGDRQQGTHTRGNRQNVGARAKRGNSHRGETDRAKRGNSHAGEQTRQYVGTRTRGNSQGKPRELTQTGQKVGTQTRGNSMPF